jgi:amino acid adenylation domain-containing protein/thioester reductase-like protein
MALPATNDLPSLPTMDWDKLLKWNRPLPALRNTCIHTEIERHATAQPDKIAITSSTASFTYRQLDQVARQLASLLTSHGVGPEVIVPLCFEKSNWMIVSMLAVLKAGGAFVAIDPAQPMARTKAILAQTSPKLIIASQTQEHLFSGLAPKVLVVSDTSAQSWPDPLAWTAPCVAPDNAAYLIFTSGSTGVPKGVVVEHRSFCSGAALHAPAQFLGEKSRVLQFAAYTHDTCLAEILTTLTVGGTVCTPSEEQRKNALTEFIDENCINWAVLTPSFLTSLTPEDVPTLDVVVLAGERLSQSNIQLWAESVRLLSGYGVSECSVATTVSEPLSPDTPATNIGLPAGGICWIVDPLDVDKLLPIGEVGEIIIEGPTVARGYIMNPSATRRAFIDPPKWLTPLSDTQQQKDKLYRTGDLGRQNPDGTLDFVSRLDSQIKISGRRIELGEIEHHIAALEQVRLCMVSYPNAGAYRNELVAILQLHTFAPTKMEGTDVTEIEQRTGSEERKVLSEIIQTIRTKAPTYMVPSVWLVIDRFPLLPSAKLNRNLVNKWLESQTIRTNTNKLPAASIIPPEDTVALQVATEVAILSKRPTDPSQLLRDTCFKDDGLDSIKAISLMRRLQKLFGVKINVEHLLDDTARPTTISQYLRLAQEANLSEYRPPPMTQIGETLSLLQERIQKSMHTAVPRSSSTVFLTGATGYLGHDILRLLLYRNCKVIALVRASSVSEAREKLLSHTAVARWWKHSYLPFLEVWLGDLSKPKLGLSDNHWDTLCGRHEQAACHGIDAIIHNAATVHWTAGTKALWPVNVEATVALVEAAVASHRVKHFVYVSGGAGLTGSSPHSQLQNARDGYTQTKLVGQTLIQSIAAQSSEMLGLTFSVVKPGFIIGDDNHGLANPSDYLWRFVASVITLGAYDESTTHHWIAVSTAPNIANMIVGKLSPSSSAHKHLAPSSPCSDHVTSVVDDGLQEKDLWDILMQDIGYDLRPVDHETWVSLLQHQLDSAKEAHLLWPLHSVLEEQNFGLGRPPVTLPSIATTTTKGSNVEKLRPAIVSNIRHLSSLGFFSLPVLRKSKLGGQELGEC